uniref:Peptidase C1A papain C-terminal domain-containing protein n=1 Tax=Octactis speculum TaxID=3111310 RepID=A0A7S2F3W4_9STRA|mmetsp:Transcript_11786/g.15553  ORF Transcript_11786/g.15553 Transcript_11786/m.15553 type:complete len:602 (+) Transcript_11786:84-1889(+)
MELENLENAGAPNFQEASIQSGDTHELRRDVRTNDWTLPHIRKTISNSPASSVSDEDYHLQSYFAELIQSRNPYVHAEPEAASNAGSFMSHSKRLLESVVIGSKMLRWPRLPVTYEDADSETINCDVHDDFKEPKFSKSFTGYFFTVMLLLSVLVALGQALTLTEPVLLYTRPLPLWMNRSDVKLYATLKEVYAAMPESKIKDKFNLFQMQFNRKYDTEEEMKYRYSVFKFNLATIDELNHRNPIALFGITDAADQPLEERRRKKSLGNFSNYESMKAMLPSDAVAAASNGSEHVMGKMFAFASNVTTDASGTVLKWASSIDCAACNRYPAFRNYSDTNLPTEFNWRDLGAVSSNVEDQRLCGAGWAFSVAQDVAGARFLRTGSLTSVSAQQFLDCETTSNGCSGGTTVSAMQYASGNTKLASKESYPYQGYNNADMMVRNQTCDEVEEKDGYESDIKNTNGYRMVALGESFETMMQVYLTKNGPLSIAVNSNGMEHYVHGTVGCEGIAGDEFCNEVISNAEYDSTCDPLLLDHSALVVGYGVNEGIEYWEVKNSWGKGWGENGYYRIARGTNECGIANMVTHFVNEDEDTELTKNVGEDL